MPPNLGGAPPQLKELLLELVKSERVGINGEVPIRVPLGPDMILFGEMIEKSWLEILLVYLEGIVPSPISLPIMSLIPIRFKPGGLFIPGPSDFPRKSPMSLNAISLDCGDL